MSSIQLQETLLNFVNLHLSQNDRWINHLLDLSTGIELFYFLESLCNVCEKKSTIKERLKDMDSVESQESNMVECLKWLSDEECIPVSHIDPSKIVQKDESSIVELLTKIVTHFHVRGGDKEKTKDQPNTPYEEVMMWVNRVIKVPSERPKSLEDWKNGEFFFNLIKRVSRSLDDPLFDKKKQKKTNNEMLLYKCIEFAFNSMGIPKIVSPSTFQNPEKLSMATYLSFFEKYSRKEIRGLSLVVGKDFNSTRQSIFDSFPYRNRVENSKIKSTEFFGICKVTDSSSGLKNYITSEAEWGYVMVFYGVNDNRRKLMICSGKNRTFIFKLSDLISFVAVKKKKQVKLEKSNGEFVVLVFQRIQDFDQISTYALLSISTREGKKITREGKKLKGLGTNRAIQKTYYLKGSITSTGIYSKSPIQRWTKKQLSRWFERIYFENEKGEVRSIESIFKQNNILSRFLTAVYEGNGIRTRQLKTKTSSTSSPLKGSSEETKLSFRENIGVIEALRKTILENDKDMSKFLPNPEKASNELKLMLLRVGRRLLRDIDVLEHLEVTDDPEEKFFSKPYRKVLDKMTEQRDKKVKISEMEKLLRFQKPWLWDCDELRDNLITQLLFSYPLFSEGSQEGDGNVINVFEDLFYTFLLTKLNIRKKHKDEEEEEEGEEDDDDDDEEEEEEDNRQKFFLEMDPTKFEELYREFSLLVGFQLDQLSFEFSEILKVNKVRQSLKETRELHDTLDHENKILEETKINNNNEEEEVERFKKKVEENKSTMKEQEKMLEVGELRAKKLKEAVLSRPDYASVKEYEYWSFLRSSSRRKEIEKMNRSRLEHIVGELKKKDKEPYLTFPVQLFLWRRKPRVSQDWQVDILKEIDPMLSEDRYRFGYVHSSFVFPSLELVWTPNSFVRMKALDVTRGYIPIVGIEVPCLMLGTCEEVERRFEELSMMLMKWNTKRFYFTSGMSSRKKKGKKCFDFVMEILEALGLMMDSKMEKYVQDLEKMLEQGVSSRTNLKFLTVTPEFETSHTEIIKKYQMDKKTKRITFDSHKKLDDFVKDMKKEESKRRSFRGKKKGINTLLNHEVHGVEQMCLGFDNAFRKRWDALENDPQSSEEERNECKPSEKGCSYYQE